MDKTHYERRSHEQGNYEITPTYTDQVVVTIKSLATGQTMKVYLDEPTQRVQKGVNITTYTGHFYEEEFMVTSSEGLEITGLPLMYPYFDGGTSSSTITVIDTKNHYYSEKDTAFTDPFNLVSEPYDIGFIDAPFESGAILNAVEYEFSRFSSTSEDEEPIVAPVSPGEEAITTT